MTQQSNPAMFSGNDDDWIDDQLARSGLPSAIGSIIDQDDGTITTNDTSWAHLIIDSSGSMTSVSQAVISGIARILKVCGKLSSLHLALVFFNQVVKPRNPYTPIANVDPLNPNEYRPSGGTAIGKALKFAMAEAKLMGNTIANTVHIPKLDSYLFLLVSDGFSNLDDPQDAPLIRAKLRTKFFIERVKALAFFITDQSELKSFFTGLSQITYLDQGVYHSWKGTEEDALIVLARTMFSGWGRYVNDENINITNSTAAAIDVQITTLINEIKDDETRHLAKIYRASELIIKTSIDYSYTTNGGFGLDPEYVFPVIKPNDDKAAAQQMADILGVKVSSSLQRHSQKLSPLPLAINAITGKTTQDDSSVI